MRVLPILTAAAIGAAVVSTAAFAQAGPGSNQPPGQATTTQSSEQKMDASASGKKMKKAKKSSKKMKKSKCKVGVAKAAASFVRRGGFRLSGKRHCERAGTIGGAGG